MTPRIDLTGQRFGRLQVIEFAEIKKEKATWLCLCDCGVKRVIPSSYLRKGVTRSCGCMQHNRLDISGQKFGRLTALFIVERKKDATFWKCSCDCGKTTKVSLSSLKSNRTRSCGCLALDVRRNRVSPNRTHNMSKTRTYRIWESMKKRCNYPSDISYKNYGGRGIKICDRWLNSFESFLFDMGECPSVDHSIDRIDSSGNYEPENCRWATRKEQNGNRRNTVYLTYQGQTKNLIEWSEETGIPSKTLWRRIKDGWEAEAILTTLPYKGRNSH